MVQLKITIIELKNNRLKSNEIYIREGDFMLALDQIKQGLQSYNNKIDEMSVSL